MVLDNKLKKNSLRANAVSTNIAFCGALIEIWLYPYCISEYTLAPPGQFTHVLWHKHFLRNLVCNSICYMLYDADVKVKTKKIVFFFFFLVLCL